MRIVLAGQKRFGRDVLNLVLARGYEVAAVFCPADPDDKLRIGATNRGLPLHDAKQLTAAMMPAGGVDLIVAAHCHTYISGKARQRAELGALGYHPSPLPRHRGRSAIEWTLRFGEKVTGGTVFWLNDVVDGGPIAAQDFCFPKPDDTALELWARELAPMGLRLFARVFDELDRGVVTAIPQETALATWEPAIDNVPPLWRPDVPQLGTSRFQVVTTKAGAA
jgi:methionyl-tRNA formyltransferase